MIVIEMPWPEVKKKAANSRTQAYCQAVLKACKEQGVDPIKGRLSIIICYRPQEGSRASLGDNARAILDGLLAGRAIEQLSQVEDMRIIRDESMSPSTIKIQVQELRA